ncbi:DUF503 domain-containing protein [Youngiibacter fragilis]|uniref:DUF503 domain-containing protein n=1 Tax=Youngiibacter fragilis 232.1 TaxID=994573 RepID=V7IB60_9CLOT|nr:DUF503 domain-containing protein [Youngiibacter fragilis]ETA82082.1 hypothetical protein T472_0203720 [Youngiibacter fragilis 232.1]
MIHTAIGRFTLRADHVNSLKEKRSIVSGLKSRVSSRFNASTCEADLMDSHKDIVIGVAVVSGSKETAMREMGRIADFIDLNGVAELISEEIEIHSF